MAKKSKQPINEAQRLGEGITKLIGEDKSFILIMNDKNELNNLTNMTNRVEIVGILDMTKNSYLNHKAKTEEEA